MDKERLLALCKQLLADIYMSQRCLNCQMEIAKRIASDNEIIHKEFFLLAKQSFLYSGTIILCKAFEDNEKERPLSIIQILRWAKSSVKLSSIQKEKVADFENRCRSNSVVGKLKYQRDKFYAHNDQISVDDLLEEHSITHQEKMQLIRLAQQVLSFVISVCSGNEYCAFRDVDHSTSDLKNTLNDLHQLYHVDKESIKEYARWCLENGKPTA